MATHTNGGKTAEPVIEASVPQALEAELTRLLETTVQVVKKYPVQCVVGGFAAGIVAGLILRNNK